jgi:hypothetical protein
MVRRDTGADEAERCGQAVEEVDADAGGTAFEEALGGVEAGRAGADDGDAERLSQR